MKVYNSQEKSPPQNFLFKTKMKIKGSNSTPATPTTTSAPRGLKGGGGGGVATSY